MAPFHIPVSLKVLGGKTPDKSLLKPPLSPDSFHSPGVFDEWNRDPELSAPAKVSMSGAAGSSTWSLQGSVLAGATSGSVATASGLSSAPSKASEYVLPPLSFQTEPRKSSISGPLESITERDASPALSFAQTQGLRRPSDFRNNTAKVSQPRTQHANSVSQVSMPAGMYLPTRRAPAPPISVYPFGKLSVSTAPLHTSNASAGSSLQRANSNASDSPVLSIGGPKRISALPKERARSNSVSNVLYTTTDRTSSSSSTITTTTTINRVAGRRVVRANSTIAPSIRSPPPILPLPNSTSKTAFVPLEDNHGSSSLLMSSSDASTAQLPRPSPDIVVGTGEFPSLPGPRRSASSSSLRHGENLASGAPSALDPPSESDKDVQGTPRSTTRISTSEPMLETDRFDSTSTSGSSGLNTGKPLPPKPPALPVSTSHDPANPPLPPTPGPTSLSDFPHLRLGTIRRRNAYDAVPLSPILSESESPQSSTTGTSSPTTGSGYVPPGASTSDARGVRGNIMPGSDASAVMMMAGMITQRKRGASLADKVASLELIFTSKSSFNSGSMLDQTAPGSAGEATATVDGGGSGTAGAREGGSGRQSAAGKRNDKKTEYIPLSGDLIISPAFILDNISSGGGDAPLGNNQTIPASTSPNPRSFLMARPTSAARTSITSVLWPDGFTFAPPHSGSMTGRFSMEIQPYSLTPSTNSAGAGGNGVFAANMEMLIRSREDGETHAHLGLAGPGTGNRTQRSETVELEELSSAGSKQPASEAGSPKATASQIDEPETQADGSEEAAESAGAVSQKPLDIQPNAEPPVDEGADAVAATTNGAHLEPDSLIAVTNSRSYDAMLDAAPDTSSGSLVEFRSLEARTRMDSPAAFDNAPGHHITPHNSDAIRELATSAAEDAMTASPAPRRSSASSSTSSLGVKRSFDDVDRDNHHDIMPPRSQSRDSTDSPPASLDRPLASSTLPFQDAPCPQLSSTSSAPLSLDSFSALDTGPNVSQSPVTIYSSLGLTCSENLPDPAQSPPTEMIPSNSSPRGFARNLSSPPIPSRFPSRSSTLSEAKYVGINRTSGYNSSQRLGVLSGISNIGTNGSLCGPGVGLKARRPSISQAYIQPSVISLITTPLRRVGGGGRKIPESTVANSGSNLHSVIRSPSRDRLFDSTRRLMTGGRLSPGVSVGAPPRVESLSSSAVGLAASATSWADASKIVVGSDKISPTSPGSSYSATSAGKAMRRGSSSSPQFATTPITSSSEGDCSSSNLLSDPLATLQHVASANDESKLPSSDLPGTSFKASKRFVQPQNAVLRSTSLSATAAVLQDYGTSPSHAGSTGPEDEAEDSSRSSSSHSIKRSQQLHSPAYSYLPSQPSSPILIPTSELSPARPSAYRFATLPLVRKRSQSPGRVRLKRSQHRSLKALSRGKVQSSSDERSCRHGPPPPGMPPAIPLPPTPVLPLAPPSPMLAIPDLTDHGQYVAYAMKTPIIPKIDLSIPRANIRPTLPYGPRSRPTQGVRVKPERAASASQAPLSHASQPTSRRKSRPQVNSNIPHVVSIGDAESPDDVKFQTVPVHWRGMTLAQAKWTMSSKELQSTVGRAIKHSSSEETAIRLLRHHVLDVELPEETKRLETERDDLKTRYGHQIRLQKQLLHSLDLCIDGCEMTVARQLLRDLSDVTTVCDELSNRLHTVVDQLAQIDQLRDQHLSSSLIMALHKLNAGFLDASTEVKEMKSQIATFQAEKEEGWKKAIELERELDLLRYQNSQNDGSAGVLSIPNASVDMKLSESSSSRSSRVSAARKSALRASKASLRHMSMKSSRSSTHSLRFGSIIFPHPPSYRRDSPPPVPSLPFDLASPAMLSNHPSPSSFHHPSGRDSRFGPASSAGSPSVAALAMVQAQNEVLEMLGLRAIDLEEVARFPRRRSHPLAAVSSFIDVGSNAMPTRPSSLFIPPSPAGLTRRASGSLYDGSRPATVMILERQDTESLFRAMVSHVDTPSPPFRRN